LPVRRPALLPALRSGDEFSIAVPPVSVDEGKLRRRRLSGRGASGGQYDKGFTPDRSRYSCLSGPALAGVELALADLDAAVDYLKSRNGVDA